MGEVKHIKQKNNVFIIFNEKLIIKPIVLETLYTFNSILVG